MSYTYQQLREAFEKVQNKEHWKNPIEAFIPVSDLDITDKAIRHFTGTDMMVGWTKNDGTIKIWSIGYRNGPAGDH